jgi:hypothetical protein
LRKNANEEMNDVSDTKIRKEELDSDVMRKLENIKYSLYDKLTGMVNDIKSHQLNQKSDSLKLQQEISILKKEKLDLYQKVTDLQRRIADMETCIGQDIR